MMRCPEGGAPKGAPYGAKRIATRDLAAVFEKLASYAVSQRRPCLSLVINRPPNFSNWKHIADHKLIKCISFFEQWRVC
jgi:hypothetical protein